VKNGISEQEPNSKRRDILRKFAITLPFATLGPLGACARISSDTGLGAKGHTAADNGVTRSTELTATDAIRMIRQGEIQAESYVSHLLAQYARQQYLNTVTWIDEARALEGARAIDLARAKGDELGALAGLPFIVKDNIDTLGFPTSAGTVLLKANFPHTNAPVVSQLLDSGAILFAKANMHELAGGATSSNPLFGSVRNPYDINRIAGGSSGGTASAIAAGIVPVGLGTDTSGSVRIPASFCGVAGLRPTSIYPKLYSDHGVVPLSLYVDTVGPIAKTVEDVALMHSVITATRIPILKTLAGIRIGVARKPFWEDLAPDVAKVSEEVVKRLQAAGVTLVELDFTELRAAAADLQRSLVISSVSKDLSQYVEGRSLGISGADVIAQIASLDTKAVYQASNKSSIDAKVIQNLAGPQRTKLRTQFEEKVREAGVVGVLFPTEPVTAPLIEAKGDAPGDEIVLNGRRVSKHGTITRNTGFAAALGIPALNVPIGLTENGLPVGLEINAPRRLSM